MKRRMISLVLAAAALSCAMFGLAANADSGSSVIVNGAYVKGAQTAGTAQASGSSQTGIVQTGANQIVTARSKTQTDTANAKHQTAVVQAGADSTAAAQSSQKPRWIWKIGMPASVAHYEGPGTNGYVIPDVASVLVTLEAGKDDDHGVLKLLKKTTAADGTENWAEVLSTKAMIGKNGLYKDKEGDNRTPVGVFRMNTPMGISGRLEGFPDNYLCVDSNYFWDGDSESPMYNRLVNILNYSAFDRSKSEHIVDYTGYYNYCIDIGYNPECTPNRGSAIFLHCVVRGQNTHGCVAIPEADMITVMRAYREGETYMMIRESGLLK